MKYPKLKRTKNRKFLDRIRELPCDVCGAMPPNSPSHIKSVGSGGGDDDYNVVSMCLWCHRQWEDLTHRTFFKKHPFFLTHLENMGWEWDGAKLYYNA